MNRNSFQDTKGRRSMANHTIAHIELSAEDAAASGNFYHDVFGWEISTNQEHNYTTFQAASGLRGGFADAKEPTYEPGRVLVYLATDDIDATLAAIVAHGGKIEHPTVEIPHIGEWAVFIDPAGNRLALFKSKREV
jgi:predicted enzyme related to lactoylglutathione lyase